MLSYIDGVLNLAGGSAVELNLGLHGSQASGGLELRLEADLRVA